MTQPRDAGQVLQALGLTHADVAAHVLEPDHLIRATSKIPELVEPAPVPPGPPAPGPYRLDADGFAADLHAAVSPGLAGYALQVRRGGRPVLSRDWQLARVADDGNLTWGDAVPSHLASVSKLIAAIALTRALRDLDIARTTAISPWLPLYWDWGQHTTEITFEELMTHTSGLNFGAGPAPNPDPSRADFLFAKQQILLGTTHRGERCYQNCNFVLCRILLATLTGAIEVSAMQPPPGQDIDAFWDVVTFTAYEGYVRDHVLAPAGAAGTLDHPDGAALAYMNPPQAAGWNSGDLHGGTGAVGWHLSVDALLDVVGTCRRTDAILTPGQTQDMLDAGCGTEPARDLTWGRIHWKGGFWGDGLGRVEQSGVYLLPADTELAVVANSALAPTGTNITEQVFTAIERNTLLDFPIRGVLLVGGFRAQRELVAMSFEDMRNTLIVELTKHSNQTNYQSFDNATLAGAGAVMAFLRRFGIRDDAALATMSADDQRNTLIVELDTQTGKGLALQAFTNLQLVLIGLGSDLAVRGQAPGVFGSWIRGVLLIGGFRRQHELNTMTHDDMRNTLIVELTKHSNQTNYQAYNDADLEGAGAVLVALRIFGARTDAELTTMSSDDQRNTLIVELDAQTNTGAALQRLTNLQLALTALGWWERRH